MIQSTRRYLYLALLAIFGSTAAIRVALSVVFFLMAMAGFQRVLIWSECPVPLLCRYDDPVSPVLEYLVKTPSPTFAPVAEVPFSLRYAFLAWYGPLVVALLTLVLVVRRLRGFWRDHRVSVPPSFAGFAYGLAILGVLLDLLAWLRVGSSFGFELFSSAGYSVGLGVGCLYLAFLITELSSLRADKQSKATEDAVPERARPIWGILALVVPLLGLGGAVAIFFALRGGDGFAVMAGASVGLVLVAAALGLGAIATMVAVFRKERWVALQVVGFALNVGIGLPLILHILPR